VKELFRLQGASELQEAEERYLPKRQARSRALILAASRGSALGELTEHRPKTMVKIRGRPLLSHIVSAYNAAGIKRINVVRGYLPEAIDLPAISYADNADYADTSELLSLACGLGSDADDSMDLYVSYGDVIFKRYILDALAETEDDFAIVVDTEWHESVNRGRAADYVSCTQPHSRRAFYQQTWLESAAEDLPEDRIHGEWMGFLKVSAAALPRFRSLVAELAAKPGNRRAKLHQLLTQLVRNGEQVRVLYTTGHWLDIDSLDDVVAAGSFA
jgi:phosphoenolpyruvate phosphomutase